MAVTRAVTQSRTQARKKEAIAKLLATHRYGIGNCQCLQSFRFRVYLKRRPGEFKLWKEALGSAGEMKRHGSSDVFLLL